MEISDSDFLQHVPSNNGHLLSDDGNGTAAAIELVSKEKQAIGDIMMRSNY